MTKSTLLAGLMAIAFAGAAVAQSNPPNPAAKDPAIGAGQQSTKSTPMGSTGTPTNGSTASGAAMNSGSTGSSSTMNSGTSGSSMGASGTSGSSTDTSATTTKSTETTTTTASDSKSSGKKVTKHTKSKKARADRN